MKDKSEIQLTVSGVAQILKIPESTVRSLERRKKLTAVRDSAGRRLFKPGEISRFAKDREEKAI